MNLENLKKLIDHLKTIKEENFEMKDYVRSRRNRMVVATFELESRGIRNDTECGYVACVIGHGYLEFCKNRATPYSRWTGEFLGMPNISMKAHLDYDISEFMFSYAWSEVDNTIEGAVKRMEWVLNNQEHLKELKGFGYEITSEYKILLSRLKNFNN